jgi:hypothetical protein
MRKTKDKTRDESTYRKERTRVEILQSKDERAGTRDERGVTRCERVTRGKRRMRDKGGGARDKEEG